MSSFCRTASHGRRFLTVVFLGAGILGATASAVPAAPADHLILSEVVITAQRSGSKYVEIVNPTGSAMPMDQVALTNGTHVSNGTGYWLIAAAAPTSLTAGGGTGGTFHGTFPAGYSLAAGDTIVISVVGSDDYADKYGTLPDFEVFEDGAVPDGVPELVAVFPGSIAAGLGGGANAPDLNEFAGSVMLYQWDGVDNLVEDLDYFHWGTNDNFRVVKSGVTVDTDTYLDDTAAATQQTLRVTDAADDGFSYGRSSDDEGAETTPGNGATGHDETSESLVTTWEVYAFTPPAPPASHHPPAPIVTGTTVTPAAPLDGQAITVGVTAVTPGSITGMDLHYTVDGGGETTVTGSDAGGGSWTAAIPAQVEGAAVAWWAEVTDSGGETTVFPSAAPRFTESWTTGPPFVPGDGPDKLLLTEVSTMGTDEFIEIHNPNTWAVDLSDYYLTDAVYYEQGYWRIGAGNPDGDSIGGGHHTSFQARFPDGYSIAAGDTIVVTIPGSGFFAESFGFLPDLELYEDDIVADAVPDMRWVFGDENSNSIVGDLQLGYPDGTAPTLSNSGEPAILYYYEEGTDLAVDIDMFVWGDGASGRYQVDKSGITVGSSTYASDTAKTSQRMFLTELEFGDSYHRILGEDGNQTPSGSNGIDGRDETSEDWLTTFAMRTSDPSRPRGSSGGGGGSVELKVPAATFLPKLGDVFPIQFVSKSDSETKVRIFDQEGRHIITLFDSRFTGPPSTIPGIYSTVVWDGRDDRFELLPAGMYLVHLSVVSKETGDEDTEIAPVVLATRLSK